MNGEIARTIIKSGVLGAVLTWELYTNHLLVERLFSVIENNTKALVELKQIISKL